jgi:predicted GNAT family acetyltransferase
MVLPLLALIPGIFSAIGAASEVFESGRRTVEAVTGRPSQASTPDELEDEVRALPETEQLRWVRAMDLEIRRHEAGTERLLAEGGRIDADITGKLDGDTAGRIAILRQTTRPWAVRMAMYFILLPVGLALIDVAQGLAVVWVVQPVGLLFGNEAMSGFRGFPAFEAVFGVAPGAVAGDGARLSGTVVGLIYTEAVGWLTGIVVAYMGLREIGKARGTSGDPLDANIAPTYIGTTLRQAGVAADLVTRVVARLREAARGA